MPEKGKKNSNNEGNDDKGITFVSNDTVMFHKVIIFLNEGYIDIIISCACQ